jgi:hypothetical protein
VATNSLAARQAIALAPSSSSFALTVGSRFGADCDEVSKTRRCRALSIA